MKKIILALLIVTCTSCSSSDDNNSTDDYFFNVSIDGATNLTTDNVFPFGIFETNECITNEIMWFERIGKIETSKYEIEANIVIYDDASNFENRANDNSRFLESYDDCYENFDFSIDFYLDNEYLPNLDSSSEYKNTITGIQLIEEENYSKTYAISGNYSVTFLKADDSSIKLTGSYRYPVNVIK